MVWKPEATPQALVSAGGSNAAQRRAEIRVTAKFPRGGKADQNRQNDKRRGAAHVQHDVERYPH